MKKRNYTLLFVAFSLMFFVGGLVAFHFQMKGLCLINFTASIASTLSGFVYRHKQGMFLIPLLLTAFLSQAQTTLVYDHQGKFCLVTKSSLPSVAITDLRPADALGDFGAGTFGKNRGPIYNQGDTLDIVLVVKEASGLKFLSADPHTNFQYDSLSQVDMSVFEDCRHTAGLYLIIFKYPEGYDTGEFTHGAFLALRPYNSDSFEACKYYQVYRTTNGYYDICKFSEDRKYHLSNVRFNWDPYMSKLYLFGEELQNTYGDYIQYGLGLQGNYLNRRVIYSPVSRGKESPHQ